MHRLLTILTVMALLCPNVLFADEIKPGEIAGTVVDEEGKGVEGALVDVWTWYTGNETKTDKDGKFLLKKSDERSPVELRISKEGFSPYYNENENTGVGDFNCVLSKKTFFEGTVTGPDGKPAANAVIRAKAPEKLNKNVHIRSVGLETKADKAGHYKLFCWPDTYEFRVRVAKVGVLRVGGMTVAEREGKAQDLKLEPPISLKVEAHDSASGAPVEGIRISGGENGGSALTGKDGASEIADLLPGKINLSVRGKGHARWWIKDQRKEDLGFDTKFVRNLDSIEVEVAREMPAVVLEVEKGVSVTGVVQDPDGNLVAGAVVAPVTCGSHDTITGDQRYNVTTKKDGRFATTLPASLELEYVLVAHDGVAGQAGKKWANGASESMRTEPGQEVKDVVIKLQRGGIVKGKVTRKSGEPAANEDVRAQPADGNDTRYLTPRTKTDQEGNFTLKLVPPGDQLIQVQPFYMQVSEFKPEQSVPVTVTSDQTMEAVELQARE